MLENLLMMGMLGFYILLSTQASFAQKVDEMHGGGEVGIYDGALKVKDLTTICNWAGAEFLKSGEFGIGPKITKAVEYSKASKVKPESEFASAIYNRISNLKKICVAPSIDQFLTARENNPKRKYTYIFENENNKKLRYGVILTPDILYLSSDFFENYQKGGKEDAIFKTFSDEILSDEEAFTYRSDTITLSALLMRPTEFSHEAFKFMAEKLHVNLPSCIDEIK